MAVASASADMRTSGGTESGILKCGILKKVKRKDQKNESLPDVDDLVRRRPDSLSRLEETTRFSRGQLKVMYRAFKQHCPNGSITKDDLKHIFELIFPGKCDKFAYYVLRTFDIDGNGTITFNELATTLSSMTYGSVEEKLHWAFRLYDVKQEGHITKSDVIAVILATYELLGTDVISCDASDAKRQAAAFFENEEILQSIEILKSP